MRGPIGRISSIAALLLLPSAYAAADTVTLGPFAVTHGIASLDARGTATVPLGPNFSDVSADITASLSPGVISSVTAEITAEVTKSRITGALQSVNLIVDSLYEVFHRVEITPAAGGSGSFGDGVPNPLVIEPSTPVQLDWSMQASIDFTGPGRPDLSFTQSGTMHNGTIVQTLPSDLNGDGVDDIFMMQYTQITFDQMLFGGASFGGVSIDASGNVVYDPTNLDILSFLDVLGRGGLFTSDWELGGTMQLAASTVVPLPPAWLLLGSAMVVWLRRRPPAATRDASQIVS